MLRSIPTLSQSMCSGREHNFQVYIPGPEEMNLTGTPYDYDSVMHAHPFAFAVDPLVPTIVAKAPYAEFGQRDRLSPMDIERVQVYYGCLKSVSKDVWVNVSILGLPHIPHLMQSFNCCFPGGLEVLL